MKAIVGIAVCVLFGALDLAGQSLQSFHGEIAASSCSGPAGQATALKKGETPAHYVLACVRMGANYVLSNPANKTSYSLDNQALPESFAGESVVVVGTLDRDTGMIHVSDMFRALPPKVTQAKSVFIDCDACPRAMGKARVASLQIMRDWRRFNVFPERGKADLIFLFSANPYLGDYLTRDGPDKRPVSVETTFMDVIDPRTGTSLWSGSRRWGSWRVTGATKDLMNEFREQLEADSDQVEQALLLNRHHAYKAPREVGK